ncbi:O-antigen ligase family protein [Alishewanella sp. BS5-314]|nr:O-antigen ligase family protein [Alishewanella sp. BS5-314]
MAVLLPAHPSLQEIFAIYGIPSVIVSAGFFSLSFLIFGFFKVNKTFLLVTIVYMIFSIFIILGLLRSPEFGSASWVQVFVSIFVVTPMVMICAFIASNNEKLACKIIFTLSGVVLVHVLYKIYSVESFSGFISLNSDIENPNYQATSFYLGLFSISLISAMASLRRAKLFLVTIIFLISCISMSLVGARSVFVALTVVFLFSFFMLDRTRLFIITCVSILTFFTLTFIYPDLVENILIIQRFAALSGDDSSSRVFLFTSAIELWLLNAKTFLFGSGISSFPLFIGANEPGWYPHNFILEILAEIGLFGMIPIFMILILIFWNFKSVFRNYSEPKIIIFSYALYALISYQFMGGVNSLWIPMFFFLLAIFSSIRIRRKDCSD